MKLLIISKYASSLEVGFESRIFAISREFIKSGHHVSIITSDSNHFAKYPHFLKIYNKSVVSNIDLFCIKTIKYVKTFSLKRILSWIDFEVKLFFFPDKCLHNPDVIIVSSLSLLTILNGVRLKNKFKAKLVFEIRDIWPLTLTAEGGFSKYNPFVFLLSIIEKYGYKKSNLVVGTMPNLDAHVKKVTKYTDIKCKCIPFGFSPSNIGNQENFIDFKINFNIPINRFIVGYAGSIGITNGLDAFIQCVKLMQDDDRFLFIICGTGDLRSRYIADTNESKNIIFIPKVDRNQVSSFLNICDILYFSSLKSEVWEYGWSPNKLIDYMLAKKPILASYSGFRSMINEADAGFFVESEDATQIQNKLLEIINIPKYELESMGMRGYIWLHDNRTWEKLADLYITYINAI